MSGQRCDGRAGGERRVVSTANAQDKTRRGGETLDTQTVVAQILDAKLVAVIRATGPDEAAVLGRAVARGGIRCVEVTLTTPQGHLAVERLRATAAEQSLLVGVGTVLDRPAAERAIQSGAQFVVSPHLQTEVATVCQRAGVAYFPGAVTPGEVMACRQNGAPIVKIFPAGQLGPGWIRALRGPFPDVLFMPTGGVGAHNANAFIQAGACALGVGGALTRRARKQKDPALAEKAAADLVAVVGNEAEQRTET